MIFVEELRFFILLDLRLFNCIVFIVEKKLVLILYYLKDMGFFSMIVNLFGVVRSMVLVIVCEVCKVIIF